MKARVIYSCLRMVNERNERDMSQSVAAMGVNVIHNSQPSFGSSCSNLTKSWQGVGDSKHQTNKNMHNSRYDQKEQEQ